MSVCYDLREDYLELSSDNLYYDFFDGGYIKPEDFLYNAEDINEVCCAKDVLIKFFTTVNAVIEEA